MINFIKEVEVHFSLKRMQEIGFINWTIVRDRDMFLKWDALIIQGKQKERAYRLVAKEWRVSVYTVKRAVKNMKSDEYR